MTNFSNKSYRENQNTHFIFNDFFVIKNLSVYEIMWKKYCRMGEATGDNVALAHFRLGN